MIPTYDRFTAEDLAVRLRTPGLVLREAVTSTLDLLHGLATAGAPAGSAILADAQTAGRGRQGRSWQSPAGQGIWLGYLARPATAGAAGLLAVRAGLAVARALERVGVRVGLKWPNDVLLGDRKVGGILCETRWSGDAPAWVAVGIGMNVHGPVPPDLAATACALDAARPVERVAVLEELLPCLHGMPDAPTLSEGELDAWQERDWLAGRALRAPRGGVARGIDPDGALRVAADGGTHRVLAGHVELA
jgi:BirA family biotin operon repressor/biotin-[acetyl-CoA-carboxylase] ligase